jgi:hypothetical protein
MSKRRFLELTDMIGPLTTRNKEVLEHTARLNPEYDPIASSSRLSAADVEMSTFQHALFNEFKDQVCSGENSAAFVVLRILEKNRIAETGPLAKKLAENILACHFDHELGTNAKAKLNAIMRGDATGPADPEEIIMQIR